MARRNRIIYASQSVIVDGNFLYRVQTLGSTSTFNSTDIFELGQLKILDVVDDVPTVAVTLDTNDWGSVYSAAALAGVRSLNFDQTATSVTANLTVNSGTGSEVAYFNGVALSDFGLDSAKVNIWAPVQTESAMGTADNLIDQTLFLRGCYANNLALSYGAGANGTENYTLETDNKIWLLNNAKFVAQEEFDFTTVASGTVELALTDGTGVIPTLSDNKLGFLLKTELGEPAISIYDSSLGTTTLYQVQSGAATTTRAGYNTTTHVITLPTGFSSDVGDLVKVVYAANEYPNAANVVGANPPATRIAGNYFTPAESNVEVSGGANEAVGAVRQGQVEIFLVDPSNPPADYDLSLRLRTVSATAAMNREALTELGHLKPYYRAVTFPVEITTNVETTAGDLETYARMAGKLTQYNNLTLYDLNIDDIIPKKDLVLVIMIYSQTDSEAGGSYSSRIIKPGAKLIGKEYFHDGKKYTYSVNDREYPMKTIICPNLKMTSEGMTLSVGSNATQTFAFRSTNKLFMVQGFVPLKHVLAAPGFEKNS